MPRLLVVLCCLGIPWAQAQALKTEQLGEDLQRIARESNRGTPRAVNADLLDRGFSVEGHELINHLEARPEHAEQMRRAPETVRRQLAQSVCNDLGFRQLLRRGAVLRYEFREYPDGELIISERFRAADCP